MTLAIHHALRTSERATRASKRATQFTGRFQTAARLNKQTDFALSIELKECERVILDKPTVDFRIGGPQVIVEHRRET